MCAQRKPAVKEAKEQTPARTTQPANRAVRSPEATGGKPGPAPKNQEKPKGAFALRLERVQQMFRDTKSELKKVTWPDRETTRNLTLLVIGVSAVLGLLLGGIDFGLLKLFEAL